MPEDRARAFNSNKKAAANFEAFSDSAKKAILFWLSTAKRDETRKARVEKIAEMAAVTKGQILTRNKRKEGNKLDGNTF
ncbi:MAG: YdeI/OmpD-associated family protein [Pyrinomonadaceae bacterium]